MYGLNKIRCFVPTARPYYVFAFEQTVSILFVSPDSMFEYIIIRISGLIIERVNINGMYFIWGVIYVLIILPLAVRLIKVKESL